MGDSMGTSGPYCQGQFVPIECKKISPLLESLKPCLDMKLSPCASQVATIRPVFRANDLVRIRPWPHTLKLARYRSLGCSDGPRSRCSGRSKPRPRKRAPVGPSIASLHWRSVAIPRI